MYAYIKGKITSVTPKNITIENNGIGYLIITPNPYNFKLNEEYKIYTYQYVREDVIELYGFEAFDAKELFLKLISVSGIGPKSALSILASGTVSEIINAIESRNDVYLKKFPGIGSKASQQIVLDLAGKLSYTSINTTSVGNPVNQSKLDDVVDALVSLGYTKKDATKVVSKLDASLDISELVKEALKKISR